MKNLNIFFLALITGLAAMTTTVKAQDDDGFTFGGAMRYNIISTSYNDTKTNPEFTWDTWRLNVDGSVSGVDLSFEYRFYPTFGTHFIHHGFLGYAFSDDVYMELGVTQVPFGITTYASHSWWFQGPYYVGLEDDYDMGLNFDITPNEKLKLSIAYFRQAEPEGPIYGGDVTFGAAGPGRYSYDVTARDVRLIDDINGNGAIDDGETVLNASTRELNNFNLRAAYDISESVEIGVSAQFGQLYNDYLDESEMSTALAGHIVANFGNFNFKGEYINYNYKAKGAIVENYNTEDAEVISTPTLDIIQMGAYGFNYPVASEANLYVAGLAYSVPVEFGPISNLQFYVDYTMIDKTNENFFDTQHLVPGMLITAGSIYTYVDYAMGKNQPWLTENFGEGLGMGVEDAEWKKRFNINIGYYF